MVSAKAAVEYLAHVDYLSTSPGDLIGHGFDHLDISGKTPRDVMACLAHNLDPATGELLRPKAKEGDRVGIDFTFTCPKSVSILREVLDPRIEQAHREAVKHTMGYIEADMQTRVRVGGADHDRVTGNLMAYRVTHRDTRINPDDQLPDPHLHDHVFVLNLTYDPVEEKFKAAQIGQIKHDAGYYEACYHNRLAANLRELGYGVRREGKAFEIAGVERSLIEKFSRRHQYIQSVIEKFGITDPDRLHNMGATTRLGKAKEVADNLKPYYVSRLTDVEKRQLRAVHGQTGYVTTDEKAVRFALDHIFERKSVEEERKVYEVALRHGIGSVTPEGVRAEAVRQGALLKDGQVTTKAVLAEESRIIEFAREGKGTMCPLGAGTRLGESPNNTRIMAGMPEHRATSAALGQQKGRPDESKRPADLVAGRKAHEAVPVRTLPAARDTATLSPEQQALVSHILTSADQLLLVVGDAGTGKTHAVRSAFDRIRCPVEMLAPSAGASRGVLRDEGFSKADTVASFLLSQQRQATVKNGVIWVDEAGLLPIRDLSKLTDIAREQNARIILQGDPKQHLSVARHGNMMNVLREYAGLPVGRLTEIWRQRDTAYKTIVADIAAGKREKALDNLIGLDWVQQVDSNTPLVDDYMAALAAKKTVLVVAPTHAEGDEVTAAIRSRLQETPLIKGGKVVTHISGPLEGEPVMLLGTEERLVEQFVPLNWTEAERGDLERYDGSEVLCFHRNSGTFKAGQVVRIADFKDGDHWLSASHFSVYRKDEIGLTTGDLVRITSNGKSADGKHKLDNGKVYRVKGFDKRDNLVLDNGWTVKKDFGHLAYGYVSTSHASQGKTVDRVLIAMGSESRPAMNAEQFYVSVSRGRQSAKVYTDMAPEELKQAIQRTDMRKSATELMAPSPKRNRLPIMRRVRQQYVRLREHAAAAMTRIHERDKSYGR